MDTRTLQGWVASGDLPAQHLEPALELAGARPGRQQTVALLDRLLLVAALLCGCSAVIFFFAYNWDAMGRLHRFALAQVLVGLPLLALLRYPLRHWLAQSGLFASGLLLGALLALVGQTYQTGADNFELFLYWALLLVPWAVLGRSQALAGLVLVLLNVALVLASLTFSQISPDLCVVLLLGCNGLFWVPVAWRAWHTAGGFWPVANALLVAVLLIISISWTLLATFDRSPYLQPWLANLVWLVLMATLLVLYAWRSFQRPLLVLVLLSLLGWTSIQIMERFDSSGFVAAFLLQGMLVLLVALGGYHWLKPAEVPHD